MDLARLTDQRSNMRKLPLFLLAVLTLVLHWFLANRQVLGGTPLPPLGRFLSRW